MAAPLMSAEKYKVLSRKQKIIYWVFIFTVFLIIIVGVIYGVYKNYA